MSDTRHRTDTICTFKTVTCGPQIKHWIGFQRLDEQDDAPSERAKQASSSELRPT